MKRFFSIVSILFFLVLFLIYSAEASQSIIQSINTCINIIIPSTFAYMVISSYIISGSLYKVLFTPFFIVLRKIIKLDKKTFSIFCISLIGGYPVGIKLLCELIAENKNYSAIANRIIPFCYCISPTFAISMIGISLYNSVKIGVIVYLSNLIANFILAILLTNISNTELSLPNEKAESNLINSINSASYSLLKMCTIIIIFNATITVIEEFFKLFNISIPLLIKSAFEISNIIYLNKSLEYLPVISMISSFGGICVIFQCISIANNKLMVKNFLFFRIIAALLSGFITFLMIYFIDIPISAVAKSHNQIHFSNSNENVILLIVLMCIFLFQKNEKKLKKG